MTNGRRRRVLFYSHDGFGLGHLRRNLNVACRLVEEEPEVSALVLAGLPGIPGIDLPPGVDLVKLPSIRKVGTDRWDARSLRLDCDDVRAMRVAVIGATVETFRPELVVVDYMPGGVWGELVPTLRRLRATWPPARAVLGLRDVLDAPEVTRESWRRGGHDDVLRRLYDRVLVYGDPEIIDTERAYGLDELAPGRVRYTGYVTAEQPVRERRRARHHIGVDPEQPLVVVAAGGGADAFPMMEKTLASLPGCSGGCPRTLVIAGPLMPAGEVARLQEVAESLPVSVRRTASDLPELLAAADCVVTMGAYNTLVEALAQGVPTVSVPRVGPSAEQTTRASLFAEHGLLLHVPLAAPDRELSLAIDRSLSDLRCTRVAPPPRLDGLRHAVAELRELLAESADGTAAEAGAGGRG